MRKTRRRLSLATGIVATALIVLSACGANNVLGGKSPADIFKLASDNAQNKSYKVVGFDFKFKVDVSQVEGLNTSSGSLSSLGPFFTQGAEIKGDAAVESKTRSKAKLNISAPGLCTGTIYLVSYDGTSYTSVDDQHYTSSGTSSSSSSSSSSSTDANSKKITDELTAIQKTNLADKGSDGSHGGDDHLNLPIDANVATQLFNGLGAQGAVATPALSAITFSSDSGFDAWISQSTGNFTDIRFTLKLTADVAKLAALSKATGSSSSSSATSGFSGAKGTMGITFTADAPFDYSSSVTVAKPSASSGKAANGCTGSGDMFGPNGLGSSLISGLGSSSGGSTSSGSSTDTSSALPSDTSGASPSDTSGSTTSSSSTDTTSSST